MARDGKAAHISTQFGQNLFLPIQSPCLNRQEVQWVHCKPRMVAPGGDLTARQLKERIRAYFRSDAPLD